MRRRPLTRNGHDVMHVVSVVVLICISMMPACAKGDLHDTLAEIGPAQVQEVVYQQDFSVEPNWVSETAGCYWDASEEAYHYSLADAEQDYAYVLLPNYSGTASFTLSFDVLPLETDWAANFRFGLGDEDMDVQASSTIYADLDYQDAGHCFALMVADRNAVDFGQGFWRMLSVDDTGAEYEDGNWYHVVLSYDNSTDTASVRFSDKETSDLIWEYSHTSSAGFAPMDRLYLSSIGDDGYPGVTASGYIDNVRFLADDPERYSLSGIVAAPHDCDFQSTTMTISGPVTGTVAVGSDGGYNFEELPPGSYEIAPQDTAWMFLPQYRSLDLIGDVEGLMFTAVPPATAACSETYWNVGMGTSGGVGIGAGATLGPLSVSAAKVGASVGSDWTFEMGLKKAPDGSQTLLVRPGTSVHGTGSGQVGPDVAVGCVSGHAGLSASATTGTTFGRCYRFDRAIGPDATDEQRMAAGFLLLNELSGGLSSATPGVGPLINALSSFLGQYIGYDWLHTTQQRFEVGSQASAGASVRVGGDLTKGRRPLVLPASLTRAFERKDTSPDVSVGMQLADWSLAGVGASIGLSSREYHHPGADDPARLLSVELAQMVEVGALEAILDTTAGELGASANPNAVLPHAGTTGIIGREIALNSSLQPQWVAARYTSDTQASNALFSSQSDAETARLQAPVSVLSKLDSYGSDAVPASVSSALSNAPILMGPKTCRQDFARWYAALEKYSEDHPEQLVGLFTREKDLSEGHEFAFEVGLGLGLEVSAGLRGSYGGGFRYRQMAGEITGGDLVITERHDQSTVPARDSRDFSQVCCDLLGPLPELVADELWNLIFQVGGEVVDDTQDAVVGVLGEGQQVVVSAGSMVVDTAVELGSFVAGVFMSTQTKGGQRIRPYRHVSPQMTAKGDMAFETVVAAGEVRVVEVEDPDGNPIHTWDPGDVTLRVKVTQQDLTDRGLDTSLRDQVQIYRFDEQTDQWTALPTTRDGDAFSAELSRDGEYMPALGTSQVDGQPPVIDEVTPGGGGEMLANGTITASIADQPVPRNVGVNHDSISMTIDGESVGVDLHSSTDGGLHVAHTPPLPLSQGEHTLQITATDNLGQEAVWGPITFTASGIEVELELHAGWSMFCAGLPADGQATFAELLGAELMAVAVWDPAQFRYERIGPDAVAADYEGRGTWCLCGAEGTAQIPMRASEAVQRPVSGGWNLLANPFPNPLDLSGGLVTGDGAQLQLPGYHWNTQQMAYDQPNVIPPGCRSWVLCTSAGTATLDPAGMQPTEADAVTSLADAPEVGDDATCIQLAAEAGGRRDVSTWIGRTSGQAIRTPKPPMAPNAVGAYLDVADGMGYARSIVPQSAEQSWTLTVNSPGEEETSLRIVDTSALSGDMAVWLTDRASGERIDLRHAPSYSYTAREGQREFSIEIGKRDDLLQVMGVSTQSAGDGAQVSFTLSAAGSATVDVLNIAGRTVKRIVTDRECEAGPQTVSWNGVSDRGTRVPGGMYLVRVTAAAPSGEQCRGLATMRVR